MTLSPMDTTAAAFFAGLVTSLHCTGMCGPLACAWACPKPGVKRTFTRDTTVYHAARLVSYLLAGAIAGALGVIPLKWFQQGAGTLLPWLMVLLFVVLALGLDRWLPKPRLLSNLMQKVKARAWPYRPFVRAGVLGLATPLIPCGPLYLMLGVAAAHGSPLYGSQFAAAFAFGTLPLLWLAQTTLGAGAFRSSPGSIRYWQRGLALFAALIMAWRLLGVSGAGDAPACCH